MKSANQLFQNIPSVNTLQEELIKKFPEIQAEYLKTVITITLERIRRAPQQFNLHKLTKEDFRQHVLKLLIAEINQLKSGTLKKVINATGVVLHTGMGRAPINPEISTALGEVSRYCNLEIDLDSGRRGNRLDHLSELLQVLTSAEDGLALNNNAAAVLLMLNSVAYRKEVILSRGEMIEIGGSFRMPEVMRLSGCKLHEIGTTNKTHLYDYEQAINSRTGAILICHTSNYEIKGFTQRPALSDIIALAHKNNIPVLFDLGSGSLLETAQFGSDSEPEVSRMVQMGFDLISFSGDKLLGGPQAGLIVGKRKWVEKCKMNHLLRALRLDKFMIKLLQMVLTTYLYQTEGSERLDAIQALTMPAEVLLRRSEQFLEQFPAHIRQQMRVQKTKGKIGSGAYPLLELPSYAIQIIPAAIKVQQLAKQLRLAEVPIITYLADEALWIDLRAVSPAEEEAIFKTLQTILS